MNVAQRYRTPDKHRSVPVMASWRALQQRGHPNRVAQLGYLSRGHCLQTGVGDLAHDGASLRKRYDGISIAPDLQGGHGPGTAVMSAYPRRCHVLCAMINTMSPDSCGPVLLLVNHEDTLR